ncbi:ATP-binding protein [Pseudonocardia alni]|uniref:ATP-binding protein n=1 Tax=Pseudonocardia alni TaxID=33907 RepID=UPI00280C173A|nr:BTAD domain-containing putative transcriptional regulator [Pseudonocardia alni]
MPRLILLPRVAFDDVEVPGSRPAALLAALASDLSAGRTTGSLVAELWPDAPPSDPVKALQVVISRIRARLGATIVATTATGYRLALPTTEVDVCLLAGHAVRASQALRGSGADPANGLAEADAGLALWPDAPAGLSSEPFGGGPLAMLRSDRLRMVIELRRVRALALSRLGRAAEALGLLEQLATGKDEEVLLELLRSEAAVRGPAAALARYEDYRRALSEEMGTDPGAAMRAQHAVLLAESAPIRRRGVVSEPNPLRGRETDVARVISVLRTSRLVTVLGTGGLGKTRLAHAVAGRAEQRTVQVVSLAGVRSDEDVIGTVAAAVAAGPLAVAAPDPLSAVAKLLDPGLLVLDNCEHVLDAAADLVHALLARTRELRVLATSRAPLDISSETVYPLPQLDPTATVALFCERARATQPHVDLPAAEVEALCARLDGLPLAVELAAARVRVLTVPDILHRLDDRFALLRGAGRDRPARHRTLEAVVEWSWNLLDEETKAALRLLSAFPGGFTTDTAADIMGSEVLDLLETLVDQSLLPPADRSGRFRMLQTVREFSAARRTPADAVDERVLAWGLVTGRALHAGPFGLSPRLALDRIRAEQENLLHVLRLAHDHRDLSALAAVAACLAALWTVESSAHRLLALGEQTLPALSRYRPGTEPDREALRQAVALYGATAVLVQPVLAIRPLAVLRKLAPWTAGDTTVGALAAVISALPDTAQLAALCQDRRPLVSMIALGVVGYIREVQGDLAGAHAATIEMAARRRTSEPWLRTLVHGRLAELSLQLERHADALAHMRAADDALAALGVIGDPVGIRLGIVLAQLGMGATGEAERTLATIPVPADTAESVAFDLASRAELALALGNVDEGLVLWLRAADALPVEGSAAWLQPYAWTLRAIVVIAHLRHDRFAEVADLVATLPHAVRALLDDGVPDPFCGTLLVAIGLAELKHGRTTRGAWLVAVAERLHYQREYQPTMASGGIRSRVTSVSGPAYAAAVQYCLGLNREQLRAEAKALVPTYQAGAPNRA